GTARADRIPACEEPPAERYAAGELLVHVTQLSLRGRGTDPLTIGPSVRGFHIERCVHERARHSGARCASVDRAQGEFAETGNHRMDTESRLLLDDGHNRTGVFPGGRQAQLVETACDVGYPAGAIGDRTRQRAVDDGPDVHWMGLASKPRSRASAAREQKEQPGCAEPKRAHLGAHSLLDHE